MNKEKQLVQKTWEMFSDRRRRYECGMFELRVEIGDLHEQLYTTAALKICSGTYFVEHRARFSQNGHKFPELVWPLSNHKVTFLDDSSAVAGCDRHSLIRIRVLCSIENVARNRCNGVMGPLTMMLGMSCLLGCNVRLQYVLNKLGIAPSYDTVYLLRKRLIRETLEEPKCVGVF